MNIGFDFDGVILDSETQFSFLAEYWSYFSLNKQRLKKDDVALENCFDWTHEEFEQFYETLFHEGTTKSNFMVGAKEILEKLRQDGHKLYVISRRGFYHEHEIKSALPKLQEFGFEFDDVFFSIDKKLEKCKELNISIMVEDNPDNLKPFLKSNIKSIYLRAKTIKPLKHKNVEEADSWMDIYKIIKKHNKVI